MIIAPEVPIPFANLLRATHSLGDLISGHSIHLLRGANPEIEVPDSETIFLRATLVFLCSAWEAFVEDLADVALEAFLKSNPSPDLVPLNIRKDIAKRIREEKHELAPWHLAADGWKDRLRQRFQDEKIGLNTPYSGNIDKLFAAACFENITESWSWGDYTPVFTRHLLDQNLVKCRCEFAHGMTATSGLTTPWLGYLRALVKQCACLMSNHILEEIKKRTGEPPWAWLRSNEDWGRFTVPVEKGA